MNVTLVVPPELQNYIEAQVRSGTYASAVEYFLDLVQKDRQRKQARAKLESLLEEGINSDDEPVTPPYWQNLRSSILGGDF